VDQLNHDIDIQRKSNDHVNARKDRKFQPTKDLDTRKDTVAPMLTNPESKESICNKQVAGTDTFGKNVAELYGKPACLWKEAECPRSNAVALL